MWGRQIFNKNVKVEWVAKMIVDKLRNNSKMRLNKVVAYLRMGFSTEITRRRAFKARQVVEKDARKQYSMLGSYGAELRKTSVGNIFKLKIHKVGPKLQPRFEKCYICFDGTK